MKQTEARRAGSSLGPSPARQGRKTDRLQLRLTEQQKALLSRAASLENTNLTGFILQKSCEAAERVVSANNRFVVDAATWKAFHAALDAPARDIPALRDLLNGRTVLDD